MKTFLDKVAVVTGAGSGIGQALAIELAKAGAQIALSDINQDGLNNTVEKIQSIAPNTQMHIYQLDVADQAAVGEYAKIVHEQFGQIDLLINNAGVALSYLIDQVQREDFQWLMNINFWGVVNGCEAFLPMLKQSVDAHIVNISSIFGIVSVPKQGPYNAAKFAVRGYSECLHQEMNLMHPNVKVSTVHPGGIATDIARNARVSSDENKEELAASFDKLARTSPEKAAKTILEGVQKNKARILIGADAHFLSIISRVLGAGYMRIVQSIAKKKVMSK